MTTPQATDRPRSALPRRTRNTVAVACPDARPPAYEAVAGLARAQRLDAFLTAFYDPGHPLWLEASRRLAPGLTHRLDRALRRRRHPGIPADRVRPHPSVDLALACENRLGRRSPSTRRSLARWRTRRFDRSLARWVRSQRPDALLVFSDVGSEFTLPACRAHDVPTVLSMVHGDVREELEIIDRERERSPEFFRIYLADGPIDHDSLRWLHDRRLADAELADAILVPSDHIASRLAARGTPLSKLHVVPYAADLDRFRPLENRTFRPDDCTFLFAGGITQRKGIRYLLEAWRLIRRPGWRLQLLGGLPADPTPLEPYRDDVEWLGSLPHGEVPAVMARADVFVFPSLFEGSAVVTYEALACGLPSIVTTAAGSVVRDGKEGLVVGSAEIEPLARAMEALALDADRRRQLSAAARARAEEFGWARYQASLLHVLDELCWA